MTYLNHSISLCLEEAAPQSPGLPASATLGTQAREFLNRKAVASAARPHAVATAMRLRFRIAFFRGVAPSGQANRGSCPLQNCDTGLSISGLEIIIELPYFEHQL